MSSPVIDGDASEARKTAAEAMSSGEMSRLSGVNLVASSRNASYALAGELRRDQLTHHNRLVEADHAGILEAAEQRDAVGAAKRTAAHLARTALMTLVDIDPRHEPARVRTALEHVYAEDPTS